MTAKKRFTLVLEGGGMRGAYTAGCLSRLIDKNITFDAAYGISTGAVHLISFLMNDKELLYRNSIETISDRSAYGFRAFLNEGTFLAYDRLLNELHFKESGYDTYLSGNSAVREAMFGVYDLSLGKTVYIPAAEMNLNIVKACCTLPLIGRTVTDTGRKYLDGGITDMIPIDKALEDNGTGFLVIGTKPPDYVRKPAGSLAIWLMSVAYKNFPCLAADYRLRHINYQKQLQKVLELERTGRAIYRFPSRSFPVSRLKGSKEELKALFELGRNDMEAVNEKLHYLAGM